MNRLTTQVVVISSVSLISTVAGLRVGDCVSWVSIA